MAKTKRRGRKGVEEKEEVNKEEDNANKQSGRRIGNLG